MLTRGLASRRPTPLLGLGGGWLTSFPMVDGEILVLEGMVEARDRLLQSGEAQFPPRTVDLIPFVPS